MKEAKNLSVRDFIDKQRHKNKGKKSDFWRKNYDYGTGFYSQINNSEDGYTDKKANVKLAVIRGYGIKECPFGLPIDSACKSVGVAIGRMAPINAESDEETKQKLTKANKLVYLYEKEGKKCPFASSILDGFNKVDCDYGDTAQGLGDPSWTGSPLYTQTFNGLDTSGLWSQPLGFYEQTSPMRNSYTALFSLLGGYTPDSIVKLANEYAQQNEKAKLKILSDLMDKLSSLKENNSEDFEKLENYLKQYRDFENSKQLTSGMFYDLAEKWWAPRQSLTDGNK